MKSFLNNILHQFNRSMAENIGEEVRFLRYLVAVSGGPDSMALLKLCQMANLDIIVAHCNFDLRGDDSDADENLVKLFCEDNDIMLFIRKFDTKSTAKETGLSIQEAARKLRYDWFDQLRNEHQIDYILTGHQMEDQIETFFINLIRGSGPKGLRGIPLHNGKIFRPLLNFEKSTLLSFLELSGVSFRIDKSNLENKYRRNFLRNKILPELYSEFPGLKAKMTHVMDIQNEYFEYVDGRVKKELEQRLIANPYGTKLDLNNLEDKDLLPFIVKTWMYDLNFSISDAEDMVRCLKEGRSGAKFFNNRAIAVSDRKKIIYLNEEIDLIPAVIDLEEGEFTFGNNYFTIKKSMKVPDIHEIKLTISDDKSIMVRTRMDGDKIRSLGMGGQKQKLQDIYTNAKLDYMDKKVQPVVLYNNEIVWVAGIKKSIHTLTGKEEGWLISSLPLTEYKGHGSNI